MRITNHSSCSGHYTAQSALPQLSCQPLDQPVGGSGAGRHKGAGSAAGGLGGAQLVCEPGGGGGCGGAPSWPSGQAGQ